MNFARGLVRNRFVEMNLGYLANFTIDCSAQI